MAETRIAETQIDREWVADFIGHWTEAWNSHRPERLLALMTEDVVYDDSAWPTTMRGHDEVRAFLASAWRAFPDLEFRMLEGPLLGSGSATAAFYWGGTGTFTGPLEPPGFAPNGRRIAFEGADFHEYRDGRVCRLRIVFDMVDVARQLGTMPAAGSSAERGLAAVQRLVMRARARLGRS